MLTSGRVRTSAALGTAFQHVAARPVRHLAGVEQSWFRLGMAGEDVACHFREGDDRDEDFNGAAPDPEIVAHAWDLWRSEVTYAHQYVTDAVSLDVVGQRVMFFVRCSCT